MLFGALGDRWITLSPIMPIPSRLLVALLVLPLVGCSLLDPEPSDSARGKGGSTAEPSPTVTALPPVPGGLGPEFFGMHDADPVGDSWPDAPVGALRVWDSGVVWNQVETAPGVYDFARLDRIVETARAKKAEVLVVLGQTPAFHSRKPKQVGSYGAGAASMPRLGAWKAYVRAVVERYAADDVAFQVWNEANVEGYWRGSPRQMAKLTAAARAVLDERPDPPVMVAPAMATRLLFHRAFFRDFYRQRVGGRSAADLVDVLAFQLYPLAGGSPKDSIDLLAATRELLSVEGVDPGKPIWNTEINYGLEGGEPATPALPERQQANVATTYLLNAADGVERVYWYSWDLHTIADTDLVEADNTTLTPAGRSFGVAQRWMLGTKVESCDASQSGTWTCVLQAPEGVRRVYWNSGGTSAVRTAFDATSAEVLGQLAGELPPGGTVLQVGEVPVLVTSDDSGSSSLPPRL